MLRMTIIKKGMNLLQEICSTGMLTLDVVSKIKYYTGKEVNYQRETNRQERSVDEKQS